MTQFTKTKTLLKQTGFIATAIMFFLFVFSSCKKTQNILDDYGHDIDFTKKFFETKTKPTEDIATIIEKLKNENERTGFVNKLPTNCGLPIWEKIVFQNLEEYNSSKFTKTITHGPSINFDEEATDETTNIIIPLSLNNNSLSSLIVVQNLNTIININCFTTNTYLYNITHGANIDTTTAINNLAAFFCMENYTFGTTAFYHIPANLFTKSTVLDNYGTKTITIENNPIPSPNIAITVCHTVCCSICNGNDPNCPLGGCWQECTTYEGGGGTGGGGCIWCPPPGGGGGGTGGGGTPCNPLTNGSTWYNTLAAPNPCGDIDDEGNPLDATFTLQKNLITTWKNTIANESSLRKGNFGEFASDVVLQQKGYKSYHTRITNIDATGHFGIDGLFSKVINGVTKYFIVEAKWGTQSLSSGPPQQMSTAWLNGAQPNTTNVISRIQYAANSLSLGTQIMASNPTRLIAYVNPDGTVAYKILNVATDGTVSPGSTFIP